MGLKKLQRTLAVLVASRKAISRGRLVAASDGLFERIVNVIRADYSATARIVDALDPSRSPGALFERLTIEYLVAYDSSRYTLGEIGAHFPHFLVAHEVESEAPGIAELARLECELARLAAGSTASPRELTLTSRVQSSWVSRSQAIPCLPKPGVERLRLYLDGKRAGAIVTRY